MGALVVAPARDGIILPAPDEFFSPGWGNPVGTGEDSLASSPVRLFRSIRHMYTPFSLTKEKRKWIHQPQQQVKRAY